MDRIILTLPTLFIYSALLIALGGFIGMRWRK